MRRQINIDLAPVQSMVVFHDIVAKALEFPSYYGRNPNAFWDCLTDIVDDISVIIHGHECLDECLKKDVDQYFGMFKEYRDKSGGKFDVIFKTGRTEDIP